MGADSDIEWTDSTWNTTRGCSREIAEGAETSGCGDQSGGGCYAERDAGRFCGPGLPYEGLVRITPNGARWTGRVDIVPHKLLDPIRWRDPRKIFVASTSDPFHPKLSNETIAGIYGVMAVAKHQTFQLLTKRAARMAEWYEWVARLSMDDITECTRQLIHRENNDPEIVEREIHTFDRVARKAFTDGYTWPLPNLWLGTSTEHQAAFDDRWRHLRRCPAAVRFLSIEPMIGSVNIHNALWRKPDGRVVADNVFEKTNELHWVIVGAESGPRSRPSATQWYRDVVHACEQAGVAVFVKQAYPMADSGFGGFRMGPGSKLKKGGLIAAPYLDDVQHLAFPEASC